MSADSADSADSSRSSGSHPPTTADPETSDESTGSSNGAQTEWSQPPAIEREPLPSPDPRLPGSSSGLFPRWLAVFLVGVIAGASIFFAGYTLGARVATTPGTPASLEQQFEPFWDVYDLIKQRYAGGPRASDQDLVKAAIKGMLESLNDKWSFYQEPADFQASNVSVGGHDQGIGVVVQLQSKTAASTACPTDKVGSDCELAVVKPIPGSPAVKAGIQAGDVIAAVDGKSLDGLTTDNITSLIKGPQGTTVKITLQRGSNRFDVSIVRALFDQPEVDTRVVGGGAAEYIDVSGINDVAASQFHDAIKDALAHNRKVLIVDLRGNGGGYVNSAVTMASEFLSSGVVVYQQDANDQTLATNVVGGGIATDPSIKVALLTDQGTASAAEILAGALQARGRAKLVGDRTYGKGLVQAWLPLPNDMGGFHLTVARWLTPDKVWINGKGLQADIKVSTENARAGTDPVLDAALAELGLPAEPSPAPSSPAPSSPAPSPAPSASPTN